MPVHTARACTARAAGGPRHWPGKRLWAAATAGRGPSGSAWGPGRPSHTLTEVVKTIISNH